MDVSFYVPNFEFMYENKSMFNEIKPELLKTSPLGDVLKIINFRCLVLVSVCPQVVYVPVLVREKIILGVVIE